MSLFTPATRASAKLRLALFGPSGSGKTYTALSIAAGIAGDGRIAVVDTENGSAALYADQFSFDAAVMSSPFMPGKYVKALTEAADAGYDVVVLDSLTHAWKGTGGVLDIVDDEKTRQRGNDFGAWRTGSKTWQELLDAIVAAPLHVIVTGRSKTEYIIEEDSRGKKVPRKLGMAPELRDGVEYEFTIVGELDHAHRMVVTKSRMASVADRVVDKPGPEFGIEVRAWLAADDDQDGEVDA